jgi:hypothetical protein
MTLSFVFICQMGGLEIEALLLAWSLRQYARCSYEMLVALPAPAAVWGEPAESTLTALADLGGDLRSIENPFGREYPIANKIMCLAVEVGEDVEKRVLLDSDMMLVSEFGERPELSSRLSATPAHSATWSTSADDWREVYGTFGLEAPTVRVRATVSGEPMPPYFNAGFVAVDRDLPLAEGWLDTCRKLDANPRVRRKRPWLDQVALPVAATRIGAEIAVLPESFNFAINRKEFDPEDPPFFCHYHHPKYVRKRPQLLREAERAISDVKPLRELVSGSEEWRRLLDG